MPIRITARPAPADSPATRIDDVGDPERERERQVEQVPVALRVPCDARETPEGRRGEAVPAAPAHQDPGCAMC